MGSGKFGGLGSGLGLGMDAVEREMAEYESQPRSEVSLQLLDERMRGGAVGALEVAILDERSGRVWVALDVVAFADGGL